MIRLRMKTIMAASLLVSFCLATSWAQKQSDTNDADSAAIRHTISEWDSALNRHDAHATVQQVAEDADFVFTRIGLAVHGRKAVEDQDAKIFSSTLKNAHRIDTVKSVRFLSPGIAYVHTDWQMTGATTDAGAPIPLRRAVSDLVLIKQNGQWRITVFVEGPNL